MRLSREKIQRMIDAKGGSSSGGGGGSDIAGGVTQAWVNQNYVSIEFFRKVFKVWAAGETSSDPDVEIIPNDITTTVKNIQAQAGLWTEAFLSALGQGSGGGTGGATTLDQLDDVVITSPTNGQALIYNATTQMWVNGTIQSGTDMATVWSALAAATNEQINASHLSGVLADYVTTTSLQTILGDYLTQTSADQRYITIAYFDRLFRAYNGSTLVSHNDTTTTIDNIKAMFGFWTDMYLSALGRNSAATGLGIDNLTDVTINTPTDGQVLQYNATSSKWENATLNIQTVTTLAGLSDTQIESVNNYQMLIYYGGKWLNTDMKTVNGQRLNGTGDIVVSGGSGNYLPLVGGTMTGDIYFGGSGTPAVNNTGNARLGRIDHSGGLVLQLSSGSLPSFEILDKDWTKAILSAKGDIMYLGGLTSYADGADSQVAIRIGTTHKNWPLSVGDAAHGLLFGIENGIPVIGTYGNFSSYPNGDNIVRIGACLRTDIGIELYNTRHTYPYIDFHYNNSTADNTSRIIEYSAGTLTFECTLYCTGAVTALSDIREKLVNEKAELPIEWIANAPAFSYYWKDKKAHDELLHVGSSAQYWRTVLPEVVLEAKDEKGTLSMQYGVAALVSAITIARKVVDHEQRIRQLEKENEELKKQLNAA